MGLGGGGLAYMMIYDYYIINLDQNIKLPFIMFIHKLLRLKQHASIGELIDSYINLDT